MLWIPVNHQILSLLKNGERRKTQKVEFNQAYGFNIVFIELTDGCRAAGLLVKRTKICQLAGGDQDTACVHTYIPRQAFQFLRQVQQDFDFIFLFVALCQNRLLRQCHGYGHRLTGFV